MIDSLVCISLILVRAWRWEAYGSILHPPLWRNGKGGGGSVKGRGGSVGYTTLQASDGVERRGNGKWLEKLTEF